MNLKVCAFFNKRAMLQMTNWLLLRQGRHESRSRDFPFSSAPNAVPFLIPATAGRFEIMLFAASRDSYARD